MALVSAFAVIFIVLVLQTGAERSCPREVKVEAGTNFTITCKSDENINDFYWYKGQASDQDLLGTRVNGRNVITERYNDDYAISSSGGLVIVNAGIRHESLYDLVRFDSRGVPVQEEVTVKIIISPDPPCPLINNCTSCNKCELLLTEDSGTLTCKVEGTRPKLPLRWNTVSQTGVSVFTHPPQIKSRSGSIDSWDSSVTLDYRITEQCKARIVLECVAEDALQVLESNVSTIEISRDQCDVASSANSPLEETPPSKESSAVSFVVPILVVLVIGGVFVIFVVIRKGCRKKPDEVHLPLIDSTTANNIAQEVKDSDRNRKFCFLKPLPWLDEINIADLYTESTCQITKKGQPSISVSSDKLITDKNITRERLVIFMGEHGDGRTTFLKHVVDKWVKNEEDTFLIIYIPLKEVEMDKTISAYVVEDILNRRQFQVSQIETILQAKDKHCLVILDGLEDLAESLMEDNSENEERQNPITIKGLLEGGANSNYRNLHVWMSSREADCKIFLRRKKYVKVEMAGFLPEQFLRYSQKCCFHYASAFGKDGENVYQMVKEFLDANFILQVFNKTPLLVTLTVHILAAKYTSTVDELKNKTIEDMDSLMRVIIDCMEARYRFKKPSQANVDFFSLEAILGRTAQKYDRKVKVMEREIWEKEVGAKNVEIALDIGLLKLSRKTSTAAEYSGVEFFHDRIQQYLADHCQ